MSTGTNINLVTSCNFRGKEYLVGLRTAKLPETIELKVTDKRTSEEWIASYNAIYIENLTHKTGNYKRFDTFVSMLKSGLLSTSHCVSLDLLKYEDLEMLRSRAAQSRSFTASNSHILATSMNNRRYLIVTYTVEFDRIHYPLALEYCGPPDPKVLQETIQRLEKQVTDLQSQLMSNDYSGIKSEVDTLQNKLFNLSTENNMLREQNKKLSSLKINKDCQKEIDQLLEYTYALESKLQFERVTKEKLKKENMLFASQLEEAIRAEKLLQDKIDKLQFLVVNCPSKEDQNTLKITKDIRSMPPQTNFRPISCRPIERPFNRNRVVSKERKVHSARSYINVSHSSSDESAACNRHRERLMKSLSRTLTPPRSRAPSPSFSDLSHNSEISRCACRNCLHAKFPKKDSQHSNSKLKNKTGERAKLLKRIQSLEKLINGIVLG